MHQQTSSLSVAHTLESSPIRVRKPTLSSENTTLESCPIRVDTAMSTAPLMETLESCPMQADQCYDHPDSEIPAKVRYIDVWPIDIQGPALPENVLEALMLKDVAHSNTKG